ncbi:hypothetical protein LZ575_11685 [Antarcticibacterium sp. 1MA-6-2]|uniref:hypothetical protein n=1 Tax=Antarcticibacterium sp. 1MA-6-2 TaxID=2908210 RepID=UPI001F243B66|nr:hypothetical protein [Antarcticibacterium sp. 1MA-6-2]UJH89718.1 hypothetical protein LZ575_11685 [Antarcticibacterium sp. 1MA-6-2]
MPAGYDGKFFGNLYHTTKEFKINYKGSTYDSLSAFRNSGNEIYQTLPVGYEGDALLTNPGNGGTIGFGGELTSLEAYKLNEGSPALNNGVILPFDPGASDFYGNKTDASSRNIGAHLFKGGSF